MLAHFKRCDGCKKCKKWEVQLLENQEKQTSIEITPAVKRWIRKRMLAHFKRCDGCIKCKKWEVQLLENQEKQREAQQAAPPEQAPTPSLDAPSFGQIDAKHVAAAASVLVLGQGCMRSNMQALAEAARGGGDSGDRV